MSFRNLNYKDNGLHKSITKDVNGNVELCIYYKRRDSKGVLSKKVVEEAMVNTYVDSVLTKIVMTRKHYRGFPEQLGDTETEVTEFY